MKVFVWLVLLISLARDEVFAAEKLDVAKAIEIIVEHGEEEGFAPHRYMRFSTIYLGKEFGLMYQPSLFGLSVHYQAADCWRFNHKLALEIHDTNLDGKVDHASHSLDKFHCGKDNITFETALPENELQEIFDLSIKGIMYYDKQKSD